MMINEQANNLMLKSVQQRLTEARQLLRYVSIEHEDSEIINSLIASASIAISDLTTEAA